MVSVQTRGGALTIEPAGPTATCDACGATGDADVLSVLVQHPHARGCAHMHVCGDCLAEGLAIVFGRRHVQQGGQVADLARDQPPAAATERSVRHGFEWLEHRYGGPVDGLRYCAMCGYAELAVSERACSGVSGQLGELLTVAQLRERRRREDEAAARDFAGSRITVTMYGPPQPGDGQQLAAEVHAALRRGLSG